MRITRKGIIGTAGVTAVILAVAAGLAYYLVARSFPDVSGTVKVQQLTNEVRIYRDEYGVPHIDAQNEYDAFFAAGYTHAQDRLWQMELARRAGCGRLSEVLGEQTLKIDKLFRTLGLSRYSQKLAQQIDGDTRKVLQAYADGVNHFISTHKGRYPVEFDMLQIEPEQWTVENSLLISRLMAWEMNFSRWIDLLLAELVQRFGEEKAKEIFPYWPENAPLIIDKRYKSKNIVQDLKPFFNAEGEYRLLMGLTALECGSNAWAVSGKKTITGKPILANDPHLLLMLPGRWYEIHIAAPTIDAAGMSIPGVPFIVAGRNQNIAWGITNAMMDDNDYYYEEVDSIRLPTLYKYNDKWMPVDEIIDTIIVKGSLPIALSIYSTHRGPIVNRIEPTAQNLKSLVSMRWTGHEISNEAGAFYRINKASNWREFQEALKLYAAPALNFVYADINGNIGYITGGKIPVRKTKGPTMPYPGWIDEYDWKGFVPFEQMPYVYNPPEGFLATANNKIIDDSYPYHISHHWESPWRSIRICEVLREQELFTIEDIQRLQLDLKSTQAREIVPYIIHAYDSITITDPDVKTMLEYYRSWSYDMHKEDVSTALFQATITKLVYNTFYDKMGDQLYGLYDTLASTPLSALSHLIADPESEWFDDWKTPEFETRDACIRKSVSGAISDLKERLGGELKEWQWGRLHKVAFRHVFGANKILAGFFNVGPFSVGGSHATVNVGQYFLNHPYENTVGASMRQIFDLADVNHTLSILPPGQSGQVFSKHYKDQVMLWLNGGYKVRPMQINIIESACKEVLILKPDK
ncbi:MAG: penicillin acylase family protein [Bacteroidetes bacterium]|nr:penicillin acylase family protein [Bacteroidota bacterium]